MTEPTEDVATSVRRKPRAGERRDAELVAFCNRMAKIATRSQSPSERRDASFWRDLAAHIEDTDDSGAWRETRVPRANTAVLEKLGRAGDWLARMQAEEVAALRDGGLSWQLIGQAVGISGEGARRRWSTSS